MAGQHDSLIAPKRNGPVGGHAIGNEELRVAQASVVAQIEFTEWTYVGHLRHAKFCDWRDDKEADRVVE
jgi:ATP-dependent DNA ligase